MKIRLRVSATYAAIIGTVVAAALVTAVNPARADITFVNEASVTGIPASALTRINRNAEQTTTTVYYKANKQRTESGDVVTIYDGTSDKLYTLNTARKTYTVTVKSDLQNTVTIYDGASGNLYSLNTKNNTYTATALPEKSIELDSNALWSLFKFDTTTNVEPGGAKKTVAGKSVTNSVVNTTINMMLKDSALGAGGSLGTIEVLGELWTTDDTLIPVTAPSSAGMTSEVLRMPGTLKNAFQPLIDEITNIKGTVLSSRVVLTIPKLGEAAAEPAAQSKEMIIIAMDVKSISEKPLPDSLFTVPKGYKQVVEAVSLK